MCNMSIPDLIKKKRDGAALSAEEIGTFIEAVKNKTIQDCQTGAMLMAIWQKGMVAMETETLTRAMMLSGEVMSWPKEWAGLVVDKHSTGGVGDKIEKILDSVGCCIVGQTETLVPADRILYTLRDVTSTVDSLPLITGSIISKKGAESLTALVLDVKFGQAALYKDLESAKRIAQSLVNAGNGLGMRTGAVLSRMDTVIGRCVGNSLEVMESLEALKGNGPDDLMDLVTTLGGLLLWMTGLTSDLAGGRKRVVDVVSSGAALLKFRDMMENQGVATDKARSLCSANSDYFSVLRKAEHQTELTTPSAGVPWLRLHYEDPAPTPDQMSRLQNALTLETHTDTHTQHTHSLVQEMLLPD
ncbi:hypothetical protein F2P81_017868 [Scophthalmus maximus]|uniref:Thymidine phosphorylase n=1 Tax=Scophthalmus maximus TaxID=52904 RepID=A0A6A4S335_SCOMX|nr:hypothetical protein F2P81_017868 [Scophthalmus maximus]